MPNPMLGSGEQVYLKPQILLSRDLPPKLPSILPSEFLQFVFSSRFASVNVSVGETITWQELQSTVDFLRPNPGVPFTASSTCTDTAWSAVHSSN